MNHLITWKDFRLFHGSHPRTVAEHSHPIVQLVLAVRGTFLSKDDTGIWTNKKGLLVAPNYSHECDAKNVPIISVDIDPESSLGEWILTNQLKNRPILSYPSNDIATIDIDEFSVCLNNEDWSAIRKMIENTFSFRQTDQTSQKDKRIQNVLDFISKHIDQNITSQRLMEVAHLSESRLIHLFKV